MRSRILIRAGVSDRIGLGHVMRCLALAQEWVERGREACFALASDSPWIQERLRSAGMRTEILDVPSGSAIDIDKTAVLCKDLRASWVLVDGVDLGTAFQQLSDGRVLLLDDRGDAARYAADIILNPNPGVPDDLYTGKATGACLLLGPHYIPVRREIRTARVSPRRIRTHASRLLVTAGGSDPHGLVRELLGVLASVPLSNMDVDVIVGPLAPKRVLEGMKIQRCGLRVAVHRTVSDVASLILNADIGVAAGGGMLWEMLAVGLPAIAVAVDARAQKRALDALSVGRVISYAGELADLKSGFPAALTALVDNPVKRSEMSRLGQEVVDGLGVRRVVDAIDGLS